jgi:hypothetical protein
MNGSRVRVNKKQIKIPCNVNFFSPCFVKYANEDKRLLCINFMAEIILLTY